MLCDLGLGRFQSREEIFEERVVNLPSLRMILDREREWVIAQPHLLDNTVGGGPALNYEIIRDTIDRLVMRAVYFLESMRRVRVVLQRLNIAVFLTGKIMPGNVEL